MAMKSYSGKTRQAYMYCRCPGRVTKRVPLLTKSVTPRADAVLWCGRRTAMWIHSSNWDSLELMGQGLTNTKRQVAPVAKFSTVAPNSGGSSVRNLFPVTLLALYEVAPRYLGNLCTSVLGQFCFQTSLTVTSICCHSGLSSPRTTPIGIFP